MWVFIPQGAIGVWSSKHYLGGFLMYKWEIPKMDGL
jgi:hypothetical protein